MFDTKSFKKCWESSLYLIFILAACIFSCSDSDDDFQSFLEKNDGSEWQLQNDTLIVYIRINNNTANLIEQWYYENKLKCFDYNPNIFIPGDCAVKENSTDCFVISGDLFLSDYEYMTFTNQGDLLRVDITIDEWQDETVFFSKTIVDENDLTKCNSEEKITCLFYKTCQ